jgi:hypothetical protein
MLADYLNPYGVFSKDVRIGNTVKKGYYKKDLNDAFERYLTPLPSPQEGLQELQPLPSSPSEKETRETEETIDLAAGFSELYREVGAQKKTDETSHWPGRRVKMMF